MTARSCSRSRRRAPKPQAALDTFLTLEAAGWKGANGTALACKPGDTQFIKTAVPSIWWRQVPPKIATLSCGPTVVAAGVLLRHLRRGYFFKIAYDETLAKTSPGVQITLDITRHLCADARFDDADSTAVSGHPMIDHIWRARLAVADLLLPVEPGKAGAGAVCRADRHAPACCANWPALFFTVFVR